MNVCLRLLVVLLPWFLRRRVLVAFYGYTIHSTARIGWSWIFPEQLEMGEQARIGHFNVAIHLRRVELGAHAVIDRSNWITGFAAGDARHFAHRTDRDPTLVLGAHSAVTKNHHLDCTDRVEIGAFTIVAGYRSQLLTHSIDLRRNRQDAAPIRIGSYCFVGTDATILGGARLPDRSALGAKSLLNAPFAEPGWLYAGVPARAIQALPADAAYFHRTEGFVT
jgi:acetyltransferase-like isoleucine patch superfamily enzyme